MTVLKGIRSKWSSVSVLVEKLTAWADKYGWDEQVQWDDRDPLPTRRDLVNWAVQHGPEIDPDDACAYYGECSLKPRCGSCERYVDLTVLVGREPDYDSATAELCIECLNSALTEAKAALERHKAGEFDASQ